MEDNDPGDPDADARGDDKPMANAPSGGATRASGCSRSGKGKGGVGCGLKSAAPIGTSAAQPPRVWHRSRSSVQPRTTPGFFVSMRPDELLASSQRACSSASRQSLLWTDSAIAAASMRLALPKASPKRERRKSPTSCAAARGGCASVPLAS